MLKEVRYKSPGRGLRAWKQACPEIRLHGKMNTSYQRFTHISLKGEISVRDNFLAGDRARKRLEGLCYYEKIHRFVMSVFFQLPVSLKSGLFATENKNKNSMQGPLSL